MPHQISVEQGYPGDFEGCAACFPEEWGGTTNNFGMTRIGHALAEGKLWAAVLDGNIVGILTWDDTTFEQIIYLSLLGIHPDFRRKGVAESLLEHAATYSRSRKFRGVIADVKSDNAEIIEMAQKLGYKEIGSVDGLHHNSQKSLFFRSPSS